MLTRVIPCLGLCLLLGCGDSRPKLVPVEGTLSLDGKPLAYKSILFLPEEGTAHNGAGGWTDGDGQYYLLAVLFGITSDYRGCPPGRYRVVVSEPMFPLSAADFGPPNVEEEGDEPAPALAPTNSPPKTRIPALYSSERTTTLIVEVPEAGGTLDLKMTSPPR